MLSRIFSTGFTPQDQEIILKALDLALVAGFTEEIVETKKKVAAMEEGFFLPLSSRDEILGAVNRLLS